VKIISLVMSFLSVLFVSFTMVAGLKAAHGQEFFVSHVYWGFLSLVTILITLTLSLMFIFKMHGMICELEKEKK
jgi:hypothetical protein